LAVILFIICTIATIFAMRFHRLALRINRNPTHAFRYIPT